MNKTFKIESYACENIHLVSDSCLENEKCKLIINNEKEVNLPIFFAVSCSKKITQEILSEPTKREFYINFNFSSERKEENNSPKEIFYNKIEEILNMKQIEEIQFQQQILNH